MGVTSVMIVSMSEASSSCSANDCSSIWLLAAVRSCMLSLCWRDRVFLKEDLNTLQDLHRPGRLHMSSQSVLRTVQLNLSPHESVTEVLSIYATISPCPLSPLTLPPLSLHILTNFSSGFPEHMNARCTALSNSVATEDEIWLGNPESSKFPVGTFLPWKNTPQDLSE